MYIVGKHQFSNHVQNLSIHCTDFVRWVQTHTSLSVNTPVGIWLLRKPTGQLKGPKRVYVGHIYSNWKQNG